MGWLAAIIGLIALVFFMIISRGFRYFIIAIVAVVVLGSLAFYGWIEMDSERHRQDYERRQQAEAAEEAARSEAARSAIALRDLALDKVQFNKERGSSWTLTGNVTNNSKYPLRSLGFKVRVEDCSQVDWATPPEGITPKGCITIGEATTRADVSVPPGQMR